MCMSWNQPNPRPIPRTERQPQSLHPWSRVPTLQAAELLHHPHKNIADLRQGIALTNTDPWSAIERQIAPARLQLPILPAFRAKYLCIWTVYVRSTMHSVNVVCDDGSFRNEDGRETVFVSAHREDCIFLCFAFVAWDDGMKAKSYKFKSVTYSIIER